MAEIYLVCGDDHSNIEERAKALVVELAGPDADDFSREIIKDNQDRPSEELLRTLMDSLRTPPFLGGAKTIWFQNFSAFDDEPAKSNKSPNETGKWLRQLAEFIDGDFPDDIKLLISGSGIDTRKSLFKAIKAKGKIEQFKKPDLKSYKWRQEVLQILQMKSQEKGMRLNRDSLDYLVEVIGTDTGRINMEIEKIFCYAGDKPSTEQVRTICVGNREAVYYALNNAIGERSIKAAMSALSQTFANSKDPNGECIRLIRQTATFFRKLLHAKLAMAVLRASNGNSLKQKVKMMSDADRDKLKGNSCISISSDWLLGVTGDQASNYTGQELISAVQKLAKVDKSSVSSSLPRQLVFETLIFQIVSR